jgi:hypothetical protein
MISNKFVIPLKSGIKVSIVVLGACLRIALIVADQIHHKASRIGVKLSDSSDFLAVCGVCHRFIEDNPTEALKMGFSKKRLHG